MYGGVSLADICVIFASENETITLKLVSYLRKCWDTFYSGDITDGDWEQRVRNEIINSRAVIPIISDYSIGKNIFRDELRFAEKNNKIIFPFLIEEVDLPFGFGGYDRTEAYGWNGEEEHNGFQKLKRKLDTKLRLKKEVVRESTLSIRKKKINLPSFVFSLSSHDTQVRPEDGVTLFRNLKPSACLISAYDAWEFYENNNNSFFQKVRDLKKSNCVLFLDSGNYEANRKADQYGKDNIHGWSRVKYHKITNVITPDIVFSFDEINPSGTIEEVAKRIIDNYIEDINSINNSNIPICPIIHLPKEITGSINEYASKIVTRVTSEINPIMVSIPERELGSGLIERFITVRDIRRSLNELGKYYPLHLLGTGNPLSMIAFAAAGADSFDGLEWCRTVADYNSNHLFHFSHFDCFYLQNISRVSSNEIRSIIELPYTPYVVKVASYNYDYFCDTIKTIQDMINTNQEEYLLKSIPNISRQLFEELRR